MSDTGATRRTKVPLGYASEVPRYLPTSLPTLVFVWCTLLAQYTYSNISGRVPNGADTMI